MTTPDPEKPPRDEPYDPEMTDADEANTPMDSPGQGAERNRPAIGEETDQAAQRDQQP